MERLPWVKEPDCFVDITPYILRRKVLETRFGVVSYSLRNVGILLGVCQVAQELVGLFYGVIL